GSGPAAAGPRWTRWRRGPWGPAPSFCAALPAMRFRQQRRVVERTKCRELAVAEREHVQPLGVAAPAAVAHGPGVAAEHEHLVAVGVERLRLEIRDVLGFRQHA